MATKSSTTKFSTSTKSTSSKNTSSKNTNTVANLNNLIQQTVTSVINQQTANTKSLAAATKDSTSKNILVNTLRNLAENLKLKSKTVGNIAGIATSVPELLTICASSFSGLASASIYNVLSSNVINLIQYYAAIILNKNYRSLRNNFNQINI